jgi:LruC domain-containing protein
VQVNYRIDRDTTAALVGGEYPVERVLLTIDPVAAGGEYSNGLGLQLPVDRVGVVVRRRIGGDVGAWTTLTPSAYDTNVTVRAVDDLRELFAGATGRINVAEGGSTTSGSQLEVEITFAEPVGLDTSQAPFDLFLFRTGDPGLEIHFPAYAGSSAMRVSLFDEPGDGSVGGRNFLNDLLIPSALNLLSATHYPTEGTAISTVYDQIAPWASSGGSASSTWYQSVTGTTRKRERPAPAARPTAPAKLVREPCALANAATARRVAIPGGGTGACRATACNAGYALTAGTCIATFSKVIVTPTGADQSWPVPAGCTRVKVKLWGAGGGGGGGSNLGDPTLIGGGGGGFTTGLLAVTPGESLTVIVGVGGAGSGFGGGGGRSAIRRGSTELATAGGGGGSGWDGTWSSAGMGGGAGGGLVGGASTVCQNACYGGGGGGTQTAGGAAGAGYRAGCGYGGNAFPGSPFQGGVAQGSSFVGAGGYGGGGDGADVWCEGGGGGGGGGYFGGGGGGSMASNSYGGGGGGGGSGFIGGLTEASTLTGGDGGDVRNPAGRADPDFILGIGTGGATGQNGGNGRVILCCNGAC